jgi:hypothetical protein
MEVLTRLFVGQPLHILVVGLVLLALYGGLRLTRLGRGRTTGPLLMAGLAWLAYAVWESLVITITPEANIRVDLLLIWPVLAVASAYGMLRLLY